MDWPVTLLAAFLAPLCPRFTIFCSTGFLFAVSMLERLDLPDIAAFGFLGGYVVVALSLIVSYFWGNAADDGSDGTKFVVLSVAGNQLACSLLLSLDWVRHRLRPGMYQFIDSLNKLILCGTIPVATFAVTGSSILADCLFSRWLVSAVALTVSATVLFNDETKDVFDKWCKTRSRGALLLLLFVYASLRSPSASLMVLLGLVCGVIAAFGTLEQVLVLATRSSPTDIHNSTVAIGSVIVAVCGTAITAFAVFSTPWNDALPQQLLDVISQIAVLVLSVGILAVQVCGSVLQLSKVIVLLLAFVTSTFIILLYRVILPPSLFTLSVVTEGLAQKWTISSLIAAGIVGSISFTAAAILSLPAVVSGVAKHASASQSEAALWYAHMSNARRSLYIHSSVLMLASVISCACLSVFDMDVTGSTISAEGSEGSLTSFRVNFPSSQWSACWLISVILRLGLAANSVRLHNSVDLWCYTVPVILSLALSILRCTAPAVLLAVFVTWAFDPLVSHIICHGLVVAIASKCTSGVVSIWRKHGPSIASMFSTLAAAVRRASASVLIVVVFVMMECVTWVVCGLRPSLTVSISSITWHVIMLAYTIVLVSGVLPPGSTTSSKRALIARLAIIGSLVILLLLNSTSAVRAQRQANETIIWRANGILSALVTLASHFIRQQQAQHIVLSVDSTFAFVCWLGFVLRVSQHPLHDLCVLLVITCVTLPALQWFHSRCVDHSSFTQAYVLLWIGLYAAVFSQTLSTHTIETSDHFVSFWRSPRLLYPIKNIIIVCIPVYLLYSCGVYLSSPFAAPSAGIEKMWPHVGIVGVAALAADSHITQLLCFCVVAVCSCVISYATRRKTEDLKIL